MELGSVLPDIAAAITLAEKKEKEAEELRKHADALIYKLFEEARKEEITDLSKPTEFERATYRGRDICGAREMRGGYCGCGSLEGHCMQVRDPKSWVGSSLKSWFREYVLSKVERF